jgi:hypothetical protein
MTTPGRDEAVHEADEAAADRREDEGVVVGGIDRLADGR